MATTARVVRFSRTERALHWVHATALVILLASGLCLYLPALAEAVGRRPLFKAIHVYTAVAWLAALALVAAFGNRRALRFVSAERPYVDSLSLDQALLPDTLLALRMDGAPLSRPHGAPARVVIPRMYGYKGVKWLARIELVADQPEGYWEHLGYDQNAWVGRSNGYHS